MYITNTTANRLRLTLLVGVFITFSITLASVSSQTLIEYVGSENAYILMFVLGGVGGLTTFTGIPYHFVLMSFAAGGINPIFLGLFTALGVMIGDSTMYLIGKSVKGSLSPTILNAVNRLALYLKLHPRFLTPFLVLYGMLSPFSNDFIVASLSIVGQKYFRTIIPLTVGNIFYNIAIAYLGLYAYESITNFF